MDKILVIIYSDNFVIAVVVVVVVVVIVVFVVVLSPLPRP